MRMKIKTVIYLLLTLCSITNAKAQDPVFTQYFLIPESINPAFTGTLVTGYAGLIHRSQWPNGNRRIDTDFAFVNTPIGPERDMGLGLTVLNQREVFTNYNYTQVNAVYSYNVNLNNDWRMRLGIEAGYGHKNFNFGNLLFEDQININNGSINGGTSDASILNTNEKIDFFDFNSGLLIYNDKSWFGATLKHLNTPNIAFTSYATVPLELFMSVHGGYAINLDETSFNLPDNTNLLLTANYMRQGQYNRLDMGTAIAFEPLILGVMASTNPEKQTETSHFLNSVNLFGSVQIQRFVFSYSYDITTSKLDNTQGVHEVSLTWQIGRECTSCENYLVKKPWGRNY